MALDEQARGQGECDLSQKTLARRLGMPLRTIQRHIAELRKAGFCEPSRVTPGGGNHYRLMPSGRTPVDPVDLPPTVAAPPANCGGTLPPTVARGRAPYLNTLINPSKETVESPLPPAVQLSQAQFDEIEAGYDRHLKHHRTEPRDTVLQMLMDQAQRGKFDFSRFRERHGPWCLSQERAGWRWCSLTFLGWVQAGMPPAVPEPISIDRNQVRREETKLITGILRNIDQRGRI